MLCDPVTAVKLIVGILTRHDDVAAEAIARLEAHFGPIDHRFGPHPWTYSRYYEPTMGPGLRRWFIAFERPIAAGDLAAVKRWTIDLEADVVRSGRWPDARPVNLDPGYVDASSLVLASTKNQSQRYPIGDGLYAEITLAVVDGAFTPHPRTFPDFRSGAYDAFFVAVLRSLAVR